MKDESSALKQPKLAVCRHPRINVLRGTRINGNGTADVSERCYLCGKVRRARFVKVGETSKAKLSVWRTEVQP